MASEDLETLATLNYYMLEHCFRHVQMAALDATRKFGSDPVLVFYKGLAMLAEGRVHESMAEVESIRDKPNLTLASSLLLSIAQSKLPNAGKMFNQAIISFPNFTPALLERARIYLAVQDWDQMMETIGRLLVINAHYPEALRMQILYLLIHQGKYAEAVNRLGELIQVIDRFEPQNSELYYTSAKLFSTICGRNQSIIKQTYTLIERAVSLDSSNVDYANEMGFHLYLMGQRKDAIKCYRNAMNIDESSIAALLGILLCQLDENKTSGESYDDITEQLDFLIQLQDPNNIDHEISYLKAVVSRMTGLPQQKVLKHLSDAENVHTSTHQMLPSVEFFTKFNPDFKLNLVREFLKISPSEPIRHGEPIPASLSKCKNMLDSITLYVPGLLDALYLSAKVKFLSGGADAAVSTLQQCLNQDSTYGDAYLLLAQIHQHKGNHTAASQCLDSALSYNFEVRQHPLYHLIKAVSLKHSGKVDESIQTLKMALAIPGVKHPSSAHKQGGKVVESGDRVSIFLELAEVHLANNEQHEAAKVMQDALTAFRGTPEEMRVIVANADLSVHRGDIEHAITMLRSITPDQPYHVQAKQKLAQIYLHDKKDKKLFISCYRELVQIDPSPSACLLLGDAYMSIQEPREAIEVYEQALKQNPSDAGLANKIGQALIKTHDFKKAIAYYETAMKTGKQTNMKFELADLLIQLKHYNKAERVLLQVSQDDGGELDSAMNETRRLLLLSSLHEQTGRHADQLDALTQARDTQNWKQTDMNLSCDFVIQLKHYNKAERVLLQVSQDDGGELESAMNETRRLLLLASLHEQTGRHADQLDALTQARDTQARVLKRIQVEQPDAVVDQKALAASICCKMAKHCQIHENDIQQAIKYHKEALIYDETDSKIMLDLAKLFISSGDLDACQQYCMQVLRTSNNNEDQASMMMADVMFNKNQYNDAIYHYEQLLKARPDHYEALARLIGLLHRRGQLRDTSRYLELAKVKVGEGKVDMDAGYQYCKGLYEWYCGKTRSAVEMFNMARCDSEWNEKAVENMIRICLNPDKSTLGGEAFESLQGSGENNNNAISTAERLIKEFKSSDSLKVQVLENLVLIATKNKTNIERALSSFVNMGQTKKDYVPAIVGMAVAYVMLKQTPKARNQLKRVAKMQWTSEEADEFEHAWLLLADIYIQASKYDMATELLKKCLEHNKSCCKAYEYTGFIYEKQMSYKDAATHYEKAWEYSNQSDPVIGYKLAFNYLKAKRNADAIDIAHKVLATNPNYPRMKKEILDKARATIRV
uniref:tetratricopeptide repeat protein 21B n=1 Tax=Ciona intestinalis TaxID=7719 RepID=UPI000EF4E7AA|nr:tetratricopeptide repeat protein 21B [Ciona intestinalis]|eukprot:XP_026693773.1 tetratricopeptide repeat protein 21B [Ciona intestinalis]